MELSSVLAVLVALLVGLVIKEVTGATWTDYYKKTVDQFLFIINNSGLIFVLLICLVIWVIWLMRRKVKVNSVVVMSAEDKRMLAYHEAGHAVAGWFLQHADQVLKVSIRRQKFSDEDSACLWDNSVWHITKRFPTETDFLHRMYVLLSGRAAHEVLIQKVTAGGINDLAGVRGLALKMVTEFGMSEKIGLSVGLRKKKSFKHSEVTLQLIDSEVKRIVDDAYSKSLELIQEHRDDVEKVAQQLLEKEVLEREDLVQLLGERKF